MNKHHPRTAPRRIAGLTACVLALAACAGGTGGPTIGAGASTGPSASGDPAVSSSGPAAGANGPAASCTNPEGDTVGAAGGAFASMLATAICGMPDLDPCTLLKSGDVQALFSTPLGSPTTDHMGRCTWHLSDESKGEGLDIIVHVNEGEGPLDQDMGSVDLTPIGGIGDKADWQLLAGYYPHLGAVKGKDTCELVIGGGNGQLSVPTTGQGVFAKVDDKDLPGFMKQFGALCSDIFSGIGA